MSKRKFNLKLPIGGSTPTILEDVPDIGNLEKSVRFSFRSCDTNSFCIRNLSNNEIQKLYKRLEYFEQVTWNQARQMAHDKGFSIEKKKSTNHDMLIKDFPQYSTFLHFRVNGTDNPFRVFGAIHDDLCCVLLLDKAGSINH
jgi:hypothetical protein